MAEVERRQEDSSALRAENDRLKAEVAHLQQRINSLSADHGHPWRSAVLSQIADCGNMPEAISCPTEESDAFSWGSNGHGLSKAEIERYSRQLILPCLGAAGQARLKAASVLVVGAGGLGAPVLMYLAAAGIGRLGIVDRDHVETSNLHRQVIHRESSVGAHKALSAAAAVKSLNSQLQVEAHVNGFTPSNAVRLVGEYDMVVDACDNAATRYLASDACCVTGRPLVSGAALGCDGQLTVYHHGVDGPCYRCLFPTPPAPDNCSRCSDAGVLGPVPGFIGCLQALETIKLIADIGDPLSRRLLLVDALSACFTTVKLRPRSPTCESCGENPSITTSSIAAFDYQAFTGQPPNDAAPKVALLPSEERLSAASLTKQLTKCSSHISEGPVLLDVRPSEQYDMCHLPGSINIPFDVLPKRLHEVEKLVRGDEWPTPLVVLCRRGNDSQEAVKLLKTEGICAVDLEDGLNSCEAVPSNVFPCY